MPNATLKSTDAGHEHGHEHSHAQNRFAVIPTPLRLDADPSYTGRGVTIAFLDSGFYPHPDLNEPAGRIKAFFDLAGEESTLGATPQSWHWHGTQTTVAAAGSGRLSDGVYRGVAHESSLVLVERVESAGNKYFLEGDSERRRVWRAMLKTFVEHWPEYLIEAAGLGLFMLSACVFGVLLFHPSSPVVAAIPDSILRRVLMGAAMGSTAVAIIYSPWGKRSGAHVNPATTLAFFRLGKVKPVDALFYVVAQFAGGVAGTLVAVALLSPAVGASLCASVPPPAPVPMMITS